MNDRLADLISRKQFLLARSTLNRLQICDEVANVRTHLTWQGLSHAALRAAPMKSALLGLTANRLASGKTMPMIRWAGRLVLLAKAAGVIAKVVKKRRVKTQAVERIV